MPLRPPRTLLVRSFAGSLGNQFATGKRADFIVLNANPLEDIRNTRQIDSVYLNGTKLDRQALQTKFKQAVVDRDATQAKVRKEYVAHPRSSRKVTD